ncbi:glucose 1-dehydrogenase [Sphingobium sp. AN641]|uniref:SDR family NAD(P)-dependent oxidoreductase n=1 Tax=Sphingobium sp. AN641 TaxID=3133443 RepID=UPI0030C18DFA
MTDKLSGKIVIVTGGTRGLGEAIVRAVISQGGRVVFGGRDEAAGQAIASELGDRAMYMRQDVGNESDWEAVTGAAVTAFGRIDGLVNNAGMSIGGPIEELTVEGIEQLVRVNQIGVLLGMKHVIPAMRAAGGGSIVNIGSVAVPRAFASLSVYTGTKAAVAGMTRSAALELGADRIRVNVIHPGPIATKMLSAQSRARASEITPLKRIGEPDEIAGSVTFLLSDESAFITGAELNVDGGRGL